MNGPPKLERWRSNSKDPPPLATKSSAKKKSCPRNPLTEVNSSSGVASERGSFKFSRLNSFALQPLGRPKPVARTPQSAPLNSRRAGATSNPKYPANPSARRISQKVEPRTNPDVPCKFGSRKASKTESQDLLWRGGKSNSGPNGRYAVQKYDLERGLKGKASSCLAPTPERTLLGFNTYAGLGAAHDGAQEIVTTPTSGATPPVLASISPEVPVEAFELAGTPIRFAAGHVIAGVHDRRKCRPRGLLAIGGADSEIEDAHGVGADLTKVSAAPPPLAAADIHWMSSPSEKVNSGLGGGFDSSLKNGVPHCPADAAVDWPLPLCKNRDEMPQDESFGHGFWDFSPDSSNMVKSPELRGLLSLNSPGLERTPSPHLGIQKTPNTGSSVSPFSIILKGIAKTSKIKCLRPEQDREEHQYGSASGNLPLSSNSWIEGHSECALLSYSRSTKKPNLADFEMGKSADVHEDISLSRNPENDGRNFQSSTSGLSFQFGSISSASNSVDLNNFQNPSHSRISQEKNASAKDHVLLDALTRISWREGLVSRIFDMGELDCSKWLSDDEDNFKCHVEDNKRSSAGIKCETESSSSNLNNQNEQLPATGFGSIELVFETKRNEAKVHTSCAESMSMEGLVLDSSDDSDWTLFYKNNLFEV